MSTSTDVNVDTNTQSNTQTGKQPSPTSPRLIVEIKATVTARQQFDLVEFYASLNDRAQEQYKRLNIGSLGFEHEWERPIAFLWPDDTDMVPVTLAIGADAPVWGDVDAEIRTRARSGKLAYGHSETDWVEDDFIALAAEVPWLRFFHTIRETGSCEDEARLPGPNDVPMF